MSLAISKTSWHYKLHLKIRRSWGCELSPKERWSLCPYFHTTVWGTLLTVGLFPIALIGWLFCKFVRNTYKYSSKIPVLNFIPKLIDNSKFVDLIDEAPDEFEDAPMIAGITWAFFFLVSSFVTCAIAFLLYFIAAYGFGFVFGLILQIPGAIWTSMLLIGEGIFWIFAFIGLCVMWLAGIISLIVGYFSSAENWISLGRFLVFVIGLAVGIWATAALGIFAATSKRAVLIYLWFSIKANGYMEERKKRQAEKDEAFNEELALSKKEQALQDCIDELDEMDKVKKPKKEKVYKKQMKILGQIIREFPEKVFVEIKSLYAKEINIEYSNDKYGRSVRTSTKVLGPIGIALMFIWSLKKGVCPLLEFVENDEESEKEENNVSK